jgi:mRNA interferase HigB
MIRGLVDASVLQVRKMRTRIRCVKRLRYTEMRVVSKARLREFWERPGRGDAEGPLRAWHSHVSSKSVTWESWADVKADFATASIVGSCTVFNIGGNKYRLVARILYVCQKVFVLKVMTHAEYDENRWPEECGCFDPPPSKNKSTKKTDVDWNGKRRKEH